ncbi:unnamed protein product [Auanema sp. JU1783]|nr:unnamed protein product [Auanema sp. JU1783]
MASTAASNNTLTAAEQENQKKVVEKFQVLREEQQSLAGEITRIEEERREYGRVIDQLKTLDGAQRAFKMIANSLVEYSVEEVIPSLELNYANLTKISEDLNQKLVQKGTELNDHKSKHNIRFLTEEETTKLRELKLQQIQQIKKE